MHRLKTGFTLTTITILLISASICQAGNKRLMSITAARVMAERALVETIHGLELKTTESIADTVTGFFESKVESRSSATISGINYEETVYDPQKDIAKVTAFIELDSITNADGEIINLGRQKIRRIGFATSTRANAAPLRAMRAAELDAYKQLAKQVMGFTLESRTTVENYILTSDVVKAQVMATLYLAGITEFFWDDYGDAHVKMALDLATVFKILGEKIIHDGGTVEVEGMGSPVDEPKLTAGQTTSPTAPATKSAKTEIISQSPVNILLPHTAPVPSSMPTELSNPTGAINLPQARKTNKKGIAVIIGNRDYAPANKDVPNVD